MQLRGYDPRVSRKKGVVEGGVAGTLATVLGIGLSAARVTYPDLPWSPESDPAIVGVATGLIVGAFRWWRNKKKNS